MPARFYALEQAADELAISKAQYVLVRRDLKALKIGGRGHLARRRPGPRGRPCPNLEDTERWIDKQPFTDEDPDAEP